jgi:phosphate starvation-inducible PhoH-like protein
LKTVQALEFTAPRDDNARLANLCGPLDENLRQIEQALDVTLARRGHHDPRPRREARARGARELLQPRARSAVGRRHPARAGRSASHRRQRPAARSTCAFAAIPIIRSTNRRRRSTTPRPTRTRAEAVHAARRPARPHAAQREYLKQILQHDVTFGIGPAGTGKTYLAVACAVDALERDQVKRIVLTRPAVEAGERLGFRATWRRRSTRTCARCTTRCTTCSASTRPRRCSSAR